MIIFLEVPNTPAPPTVNGLDGLTEIEMTNAIEVEGFNDRPVAVQPGESVVYKVGEDTHIKVFAITDPSLTGAAPLSSLTTTQICGVDVYRWGALIYQKRA